jgi:hypothetical protein
MAYVRCIQNEGCEASLQVGKVYKTLPTTRQESRDKLLRVIDNEGEDYLYDSDYFEAVDLKTAGEQEAGLAALTIHLPPLVKAIVQAEALAVHKSVGALVREWVDERLDLPTN